jgi:cyclopropane-fatty-acyl-phospholipid synthase
MIRNYINKLARNIVSHQLAKIHHGQLLITENKKVSVFGARNRIRADIKVLNPNFYAYILFGGSIGAAESYMRGDWRSKNLTDVIRLMAVNSVAMDSMEGSYKFLLQPLLKIIHYLNKNTVAGSKKNIVRHYDLSNDFFALFLDASMMYSSAIYANTKMNLEEAAINKIKIICEKLKLKSTDRLVEIGSGWGGFAIYAAQNYGCHVTTTTISEQQFLYVKNKIKQLKLSKKITLVKKDYRQLTGKYNKLVSIEMIEAVGHHFYDTYFSKIATLLTDDGDALIQAITIRDQRYKAALKSVDFIQKYIFPGSTIPSVTSMQESLTRATDMTIFDIQDIGSDYARTLNAWKVKFVANKARIKELGFDAEFMRMWFFYFCYCEGGFKEKVISDIHLHLTKPLYRN